MVGSNEAGVAPPVISCAARRACSRWRAWPRPWRSGKPWPSTRAPRRETRGSSRSPAGGRRPGSPRTARSSRRHSTPILRSTAISVAHAAESNSLSGQRSARGATVMESPVCTPHLDRGLDVEHTMMQVVVLVAKTSISYSFQPAPTPRAALRSWATRRVRATICSNSCALCIAAPVPASVNGRPDHGGGSRSRPGWRSASPCCARRASAASEAMSRMALRNWLAVLGMSMARPTPRIQLDAELLGARLRARGRARSEPRRPGPPWWATSASGRSFSG